MGEIIRFPERIHPERRTDGNHSVIAVYKVLGESNGDLQVFHFVMVDEAWLLDQVSPNMIDIIDAAISWDHPIFFDEGSMGWSKAPFPNWPVSEMNLKNDIWSAVYQKLGKPASRQIMGAMGFPVPPQEIIDADMEEECREIFGDTAATQLAEKLKMQREGRE